MEKPLLHPYNRSNLFLVRLWSINPGNADGENSKVAWSGKVQRVVDGESHQFINLLELVELLETMVSTDYQP